MLRRFLKEQYEIEVEQEINIDDYKAFISQENVYLLTRPGSNNEEDLRELQSMALHLAQYGDRTVTAFMETKEGTYISQLDNDKYCLLATQQLVKRNQLHLGRKLAKFHYRGRLISSQMNRTKRIGQWKKFWEQRLDQLEKVWNSKLFQNPEEEFDRYFLDSFPYYMGLTENAIQYIVDTELDDDPQTIDNGTICHERYTSKTWGRQYMIKNPLNWIFDHASRDIAEWVRQRYYQNSQTYDRDVKGFLTEYQSITPLSPFSWRLLYARLMFPLHYFDCVEGYYMANSEQQRKSLEEQLVRMVQQSGDYEQFLRYFFQMVEVPVNNWKVPQLDWFKK